MRKRRFMSCNHEPYLCISETRISLHINLHSGKISYNKGEHITQRNFIDAHMYVYVYVYVYVNVNVYVYVYVYIYVYIIIDCLYVYIYTHIYVYVHIASTIAKVSDVVTRCCRLLKRSRERIQEESMAQLSH